MDAPSKAHAGRWLIWQGLMWAAISATAYALASFWMRFTVSSVNSATVAAVISTPAWIVSVAIVAGSARRREQLAPHSAAFVGVTPLLVMAGVGAMYSLVGNQALTRAIEWGGLGIAVSLQNTATVWGAAMAAAVLREPFTPRMRLGALIVLAGLGLLGMAPGAGFQSRSLWFAAMGLAVLAGFTYGLGSVASRWAMGRRLDPIVLIALSSTGGLSLLYPLLIISGKLQWSGLALDSYLGLAAGGLCNMVAQYALIRSLQLAPVALASVLQPLQMVLAPLFGWLWLGEGIETIVWLGVLLILLGIVMVVRGRAPAHRPRDRGDLHAQG